MKTYAFDRDALCALWSLLDLVYYDTTAECWLEFLPIELRQDMLNLIWLEDEQWQMT